MSPVDTTWKALADPHRRHILSILRHGPRRAGELAHAVGLAPNAVSFHLRWLLAASLVSVERQGRCLWYRLRPGGIEAWQAEMQALLGAPTASAQAGHGGDGTHAVSGKRKKKPAARGTRRRKARGRPGGARLAAQARSTMDRPTGTESESTLGSQMPAELL